MIEFIGHAASEGISVGRCNLLEKYYFKVPRYSILKEDVVQETGKLEKAINKTKGYFNDIKAQSMNKVEKEHLFIFDVYLMLLDDDKYTGEALRLIEEKLINAEYAILLVTSKIIKSFRSLENEYFRERKNDIESITMKLINEMRGDKSDKFYEAHEDEIIVSFDLSPYEATMLINKKILGFVTEKGSKVSHTSILARSIGIPYVVGIAGIIDKIDNGQIIILDGFNGKVIVDPDEDVLKLYKQKERRYRNYIKELSKLKDEDVKTLDGVHINIYTNIEINEEIKMSNDYNAEGIGLYRTEFMYLKAGDISEDEQFNILKGAIQKNRGKPLFVRTFDLGGEKLNNILPHPKEENPALGLRAIRYSLKYEDFFKKQIKAILRASAFGDVRIMIPMISGIEEIRQAKEIIERVKKELGEQNDSQLKFKSDIPVGVMVEIPSLAIIAGLAAKEVDFFSVGSNDLIQYTLGIDRGNENVSYLYRPTHLAFLFLLERILKAAEKNNIEATVCGEIAGEPKYIAVLLGLGYKSLSMSPSSILRAKMIIKRLSIVDCKKMVKKLQKNKIARKSEEDLEIFIEKYASDVYFH